jgi:coproporphyrinogen III oxidase-like Fe-S oxidoreductase
MHFPVAASGLAPMPWFERPLIALLERQYGQAMRFEAGGRAPEMPPPPAGPCQLYVHIPFCEVLCPFCSFHRVRFDATRARPYFEALRREIALYQAAGYSFRDVYVGGGTPTVDPQQLLATLDFVRSLWPVQSISVETNPNHLQPGLLQQLRRAGVTRLSVGVQSFDDGLLAAMDRLHKYGSGEQIRQRLQEARGIVPTLNVDMIFNLPGQTLAMLGRDLDHLLALGVEQVSFYPLMTARASRRRMTRTMGLADPALRHPMYELIGRRLQPGYRASSAWCFARGEGQYDEYIIDQDDYVGVGSGAFSYVGGTLYSTTFSLRHYLRRVGAGGSGIAEQRRLSARERMRYDLLMRLFGGELDLAAMRARHGRDFARTLAPELTAMRLLGATRRDGDTLCLTARGRYVWVLMMAEFFNAVNEVRSRMREHIRTELDSWSGEAAVPLAAIGRPPRDGAPRARG